MASKDSSRNRRIAHRSFTRYWVGKVLSARFIARGLRIGGELQMISRRGFFLRTNQATLVGTTGHFGAEFPNGFFRASVVVRFVEPDWGVGFEFINMSSLDQKLLQGFCGSLCRAESQDCQNVTGEKANSQPHKTHARGFSLIELLIVVAIILIIAAIAIPNFLRSRIAANQSSAVASCRLVNISEVMYATTYGIGFSSDLLSLGPPTSGVPTTSAAALMDSLLAAGSKSGYGFVYTPGPLVGGQINSYTLNANPLTPGTTGMMYFFSDVTGVIRQNLSGSASSSDSPVGN